MDYQKIRPYIERGLITEQSHPEDENVRIFNYSQACQFERAWDEVTMNCRGLIVNIATGEILARPFPKFFNYGEHVEKNMSIPNEQPFVYDKLDGSLGILYRLNGRPYIATRGSFTSDQAIWATEWFRTRVGMLPSDNVTHLFEIIYPENRIVVNYDFSGLVHLATLEIASGRMIPYTWGEPIRELKQYPFTSFQDLAMRDEPNREGFVLYFPIADMRMKIKFPEYVRLHKLITGVSEIAIWEHLRDGKTLTDLIEKVPDEFMQWVDGVSNRISSAFEAIETIAKRDFENILEDMVSGYVVDVIGPSASYRLTTEGRKEFAMLAQEKKNPGLLFSMLDGKDYKPAIWRMVRPKGRSAFKVDIDA